MRFGENNVLCPKYINIYEFRRVRTCSTKHFLFIIKKMEKEQEHDLYLNQIRHHFYLQFFFLGWIIKILRKWGPTTFSLTGSLTHKYKIFYYSPERKMV